MIQLNRDLADELGLDADALASDEGAAIFAGNLVPEGAEPLAPGLRRPPVRRLLPPARRRAGPCCSASSSIATSGAAPFALKGSGRTPFSRGCDGKAALGPVLREYLLGEAMHAMGVPTTRALAPVTTGEQVRRDTLLPGAVLCRVAASHVRVGTFELFAARREHTRVQQLAEYVIQRH